VRGLRALVKKELSDHLSSYRFILLFSLILMVSLVLVYAAAGGMEGDLKGGRLPKFVFLMLFTSSKVDFSLVQFVAFFGPLIGIILGFDSINRERNEGTLSKILAQPVYRDTVINGKFLAGLVIISLMMTSIILIITGLGIYSVGVKPGIEEFWRIFIYLIISIVYISLWLGVSILFSVLFRSVATSALASFAIWIFFSFFLSFGINTLIDEIMSSVGPDYGAAMLKVSRIEQVLSFTSPLLLYNDSTTTIIDPMRRTLNPYTVRLGLMEQASLKRFTGPLALMQSFLLVAPYIVYLISVTVICFLVSYIIFMRQEIRSV
jgi:ABC-2 type transport system permease protein